MEKKNTASVPARSEMNPEFCWDLSGLYASPEDWEKDFKRLDGLLRKVMAFRGHLGDSPETLLAALKADDELDFVLEKLATYAGHRHDEDTTDSKNTAREARISTKDTRISGETSWFEPELMAIPVKKFEKFRNSPVLAFYKRTLDDTERERAHTLSEPEERILSLAGDALSVSYKAFEMLHDADMRFPKIKNEDGKKVEVTNGNYIGFLQSADRRVRKDAFGACYDTYKSLAHTYAATLEGLVKSTVFECKLRHYPSAREAALFSDNIPLSVYDNLIDSVHKGLPALYRYFALRAKILGLKKLDMYDIMNPLVPSADMKIPFDEAKKIIKRALKPMGKAYGEILDKAFNERWIDVYENRGKRSGAYSGGFFRTPANILMSYRDDLDSVFTLVHELGHSMHSWFSQHAQEYHYADYRLFVAEVASTTNEMLLYHDLMKHVKSDEMRAYLLNFLLDTIRGTCFRQTMFAEFERDIYAMCEADDPITEQSLSDHYFELNKLYHGPAVEPDSRIRYEWARIPHFYYNFYVYKYATGISAAAALSRDILAGKTDRYMNFLKAGDSKDVIDIMKDAGVDFTSPEPVDACMQLFSETVDELEKLLNKKPEKTRKSKK